MDAEHDMQTIGCPSYEEYMINAIQIFNQAIEVRPLNERKRERERRERGRKCLCVQ